MGIDSVKGTGETQLFFFFNLHLLLSEEEPHSSKMWVELYSQKWQVTIMCIHFQS